MSLLHTLTQLTVMMTISSWNLHWTSSTNISLCWCQRHGYSFASSRATCSVTLLFRLTFYMSYHAPDICSCMLFLTHSTSTFALLSVILIFCIPQNDPRWRQCLFYCTGTSAKTTTQDLKFWTKNSLKLQNFSKFCDTCMINYIS
jgi:hypothetical protein